MQSVTKGITKCDRLLGYKARQEYVTKHNGYWITTNSYKMDYKIQQNGLQSVMVKGIQCVMVHGVNQAASCKSLFHLKGLLLYYCHKTYASLKQLSNCEYVVILVGWRSLWLNGKFHMKERVLGYSHSKGTNHHIVMAICNR